MKTSSKVLLCDPSTFTFLQREHIDTIEEKICEQFTLSKNDRSCYSDYMIEKGDLFPKEIEDDPMNKYMGTSHNNMTEHGFYYYTKSKDYTIRIDIEIIWTQQKEFKDMYACFGALFQTEEQQMYECENIVPTLWMLC